MKHFIFKGTPGSGKTDVIKELENLCFIQHTDARKISYEDALIFEQIKLDVYVKFGFEIVLVPNRNVIERCEFILKNIVT